MAMGLKILSQEPGGIKTQVQSLVIGYKKRLGVFLKIATNLMAHRLWTGSILGMVQKFFWFSEDLDLLRIKISCSYFHDQSITNLNPAVIIRELKAVLRL